MMLALGFISKYYSNKFLRNCVRLGIFECRPECKNTMVIIVQSNNGDCVHKLEQLLVST